MKLTNARIRCWTDERYQHKTACTSEGRFHGGLHHADQQLETLGVLGEAGGERCQGVRMPAQVLQGNPLTEVGLQGEDTAEGVRVGRYTAQH